MNDEKTATQAEDAAIAEKDQTTVTDQSPPEEVKPETEEKPKKTAWYSRVIAREAAEKREAKREAEIAKAQLAAVLQERASNPEGKTSLAMTQAEIDRRAEELAEQKTNAREFTNKCNEVAEKGNEEFEDFDKSVGTLQQMGGNYQGLLQIATELDDAHRILYHLGQNPDEAEQLLSLPPTKMAIAVAKIESKLIKSSEKTISSAPTPITPIKPKASKAFDPNDPNADRNEWSKWREKTRRKR